MIIVALLSKQELTCTGKQRGKNLELFVYEESLVSCFFFLVF